MANINDFLSYCTAHALMFLDRVAIVEEVGQEELEDDVAAWGCGGHPSGGVLPVIILMTDGMVHVLKAWSSSPTQDDVWTIVTDDELMLGLKGFRLHAPE